MPIPELLGLTGKNLKQKFFVAQNSTFGTALAINADPAAIAATEASLILSNNGAVDGDGKKVIVVPSYITLVTDTVAASGTSFMISYKLDNKLRYSSGGAELTGYNTFISQKTDYTALDPYAVAYFGDITASAEGSGVVPVGQSIFSVQTAAQIKGNVYHVQFGGDRGSVAGVRSMTAEGFHSDIKSPMYLDPQCSLVLQIIETSAATTAAKFHVEMGWYELDNFPAFSA